MFLSVLFSSVWAQHATNPETNKTAQVSFTKEIRYFLIVFIVGD